VYAAEIGERTPASFRLGQTAPAQIRLIELQVDPHLVLHLTLEVSAPAADSKPRLHARDQTHVALLDMSGEHAALLLGRQGEAPSAFGRHLAR
jgi:hypothetical protein